MASTPYEHDPTRERQQAAEIERAREARGWDAGTPLDGEDREIAAAVRYDNRAVVLRAMHPEWRCAR